MILTKIFTCYKFKRNVHSIRFGFEFLYNKNNEVKTKTKIKNKNQ